MNIIIQFSEEEEARALPLLLRHSTGTVLPGRTYAVSREAVAGLREAGVCFVELTRERSGGCYRFGWRGNFT